MNNWTRKRKARGFTLVELLIVIVIIGILAGSMLLVFGSATDKAKATRIVSDMRNLKAAALMYYADYNDWPSDTNSDAFDDALKPYMDRDKPSQGEYATYGIDSGDIEGVASAGVFIYASGFEQGIGSKLKEIADDEGSIIVTTSGDVDEAYMMLSRTQ